ncbi:hypothetical protein VP01_2499g1 [Puccinia sorghi]|uniref:Uncharacterized protein n=1 Tax=Puccinia sorghi TaxID=27349 RepID=A0A0L6V5R2_9BASI|nr:hypothetical protein VP01_2499g1 [Puccinia sorghi]
MAGCILKFFGEHCFIPILISFYIEKNSKLYSIALLESRISCERYASKVTDELTNPIAPLDLIAAQLVGRRCLPCFHFILVSKYVFGGHKVAISCGNKLIWYVIEKCYDRDMFDSTMVQLIFETDIWVSCNQHAKLKCQEFSPGEVQQVPQLSCQNRKNATCNLGFIKTYPLKVKIPELRNLKAAVSECDHILAPRNTLKHIGCSFPTEKTLPADLYINSILNNSALFTHNKSKWPLKSQISSFCFILPTLINYMLKLRIKKKITKNLKELMKKYLYLILLFEERSFQFLPLRLLRINRLARVSRGGLFWKFNNGIREQRTNQRQRERKMIQGKEMNERVRPEKNQTHTHEQRMNILGMGMSIKEKEKGNKGYMKLDKTKTNLVIVKIVNPNPPTHSSSLDPHSSNITLMFSQYLSLFLHSSFASFTHTSMVTVHLLCLCCSLRLFYLLLLTASHCYF